jgi:hypothetical protein
MIPPDPFKFKKPGQETTSTRTHRDHQRTIHGLLQSSRNG